MHVQLLQYLSEECGPCSLSEFKAFLENRGRIRTQLIEDLRKKRMPHYFHTMLILRKRAGIFAAYSYQMAWVHYGTCGRLGGSKAAHSSYVATIVPRRNVI